MIGMYLAALIVHLCGAGVTALALAASCYALSRGKEGSYLPLAVVLGVVAAFEIITGTALMMLSANATTITCRNMAIYLALVVGMQIALLLKSTRAIKTPLVGSWSPIALSLLLTSALLYSI